MPTTVSKTIGTGGDYTTIQAWEDACPANLVSSDQIWQGQLKNEVFAAFAISGETTDSTRYIELKCETGASFRDNANVQTNALRYNSSNGAAISTNSNYYPAVDISGSIAFRLIGIQARNQGLSDAMRNGGNSTSYPSRIDGCIFETAGGSAGAIWAVGAGVVISNTLALTRAATPTRIVRLNQGAVAVGCTFVATQGAASYLTDDWYANADLTNCAAMNVSAITPDAVTATNCYTNMSSPPSGWTNTAYSTSSGVKFQNITDGSHDYRIQSGSSLIDAGTTSSTYGTPDIAGTSRPSGSSYDVGAWEYVSAGGGSNLSLDSGSYTVTSNAVTLKVSRTLSFNLGSYTVIGKTTTLSINRKLSFNLGTYTFIGKAVSLAKANKIAFGLGTYVLTGNTISLAYSGATYTLALNAGSYVITGKTLGLNVARKLALNAGSYTYTGNTTGLSFGHKLTLAAGSYIFTGKSSSLIANRKLALALGNYTFDGKSQTLTYSAAPPGTMPPYIVVYMWKRTA